MLYSDMYVKAQCVCVCVCVCVCMCVCADQMIYVEIPVIYEEMKDRR